MHQKFADWYRPCTTGTELNLTEGLLRSRWTAIEKVRSEITALDLVKIALGRPVNAETAATFRQAFKEADVTFQMDGNDFELSILAGSVLSNLFDSEECDSGALGLLCAVGLGVQRPSWVEVFIQNAEVYLDKRLHTVRSHSEISPVRVDQKALKAQLDAFAAKIPENQVMPSFDAVKNIIDLLMQNMTKLATATAKCLAELQRQSILRKEETDVLSWMIGAVSRDGGVLFQSLNTAEASLIAGKELADLVRSPGICAGDSILQGIIPAPATKAAEKAVSLFNAVNGTDRNWRSSVLALQGVGDVVDLCPVLGAIRCSLDTDEVKGWKGAFTKAYGIDPSKQLSFRSLASQMYRECLLAKAESLNNG